MIEAVSISFATLFATIDPIGVAIVFTTLVASVGAKEQLSIGLRGILIALFVLLSFAFFGQMIMTSFGITLSSLRAAGGILFLIFGIDMIFGKKSRLGRPLTEGGGVQERRQFAVCPVAVPIIAGPGALGAVIFLMADAEGDFLKQGIVVAAIVCNLGLTFIFFLLGGRIQQTIGVSGARAIGQVMGILLLALGMQFIFDGIKGAKIFPYATL